MKTLSVRRKFLGQAMNSVACLSAAATILEKKAVGQDDIKTGRWINGNAWRLLDDHGKIMYITAWGDGTGIAILNWLTTAKPKPSMEEFRRQESWYVTDGPQSDSDYVQELDRFYADSPNLRIPVTYAVLFVIKKFRGTSRGELTQFLNGLRTSSY